MKRLQWFNLIGVLALAVLCVAQWQRDRQMNLEIIRLEKIRLAHEQKVAEQEKAAGGLSNDLAHFKQLFQGAHTNLSEARAALKKLERENSKLGVEREQLKSSVTNWAAAVAARDEQLEKANAQLHEFSARLNETVHKFNELTTNHNAAIRRFNELATNYNDVVRQLNELRVGKTFR